MNKEDVFNADESSEKQPDNGGELSLIPPGGGDDPPNEDWVTLDQISPIAGALAGGITITLLGSGFQPGATVYFGSAPADQVTFESEAVIYAVVPAASQAGSVAVAVINPDGGTARLPGGFTYVATTAGEQAEVLGVTPLAVIENTQSVVTIRGRNLIAAFNDGLLALRGPSRCQITFLDTTTSHDADTGIDTVRMTVQINCAPPLESYERIAVQVLASRRSGAASDGIVESSRHMFTVLPGAAPAVLAYTANLDPSKPNLVMVAGRNLDGHALTLSDGTAVEFQKSDGNFVSGLVTLPEKYDASAPLQLTLVDNGGSTVAGYDLSFAPESGALQAGAKNNFALAASGADELSLNLTPAPGQQFTGPTREDSAVFSANGQNLSSQIFDWGNFAITIIDITIILPIINDVYMLPLFDGGGAVLDSPVAAEVGKLFRLRGAGLLVALRVEVVIHIEVVLIIGFIYEIWGYGLYNEFPEFGWSIGSIVIGIQINIEIYFNVAWMVALVKPNGQLEVIAAFNLTLGIDFSIDSDGHLHFDAIFTHAVHIIGITSMPNNLLPCGGKFQLVSDNGQTAFPDARGGFESYYFVREAGGCCVPWNFDMELLRFSSGGEQEVVQSSFQTSYCLTATESPALYDVVITSEPPPDGFPPPHLVMDVGESAVIKALARPVDASGNPTGAPAIDLRDLGYDVEFFLVDAAPTVLDPVALQPGQAYAYLPGDNSIRARIKPAGGQTPLAFWKGSVYGFRRSPNAGEAPSIEAGNLPVTVNQVTEVKVELSLAYRDPATNKVEPVRDIYRDEAEAPNPRNYFLAGRFRFPPNSPSTIKARVKVDSASLLVGNTAGVLPFPTGTFGNRFERPGGNALSKFFTGRLIQAGVELEATVNTTQNTNDYVAFDNAEIIPNREEEVTPGTTTIVKFVPPGPFVTGHLVSASCKETSPTPTPRNCRREVKVELKFSELKVTDSSGSTRVGSTLLTAKLDPMISNEETFEEYFRVFREVRGLMKDKSDRGVSGKLGNFARELIDALGTVTSVSDVFLKDKGNNLWQRGLQLAKSATPDDRILYFARLEALAVLRDLQNRKLSRLSENQLNIFEYFSRGLTTTDGTDARIEFPAAAVNRVVVTGFDPFQLYISGLISNSSGLIAMKLSGEKVKATNSQKEFSVQSAVFPVRFRDFGSSGTDTDGLVEKVMRRAVVECEMIMTCSWTGFTDRFNIDRFATRFRAKQLPDNERIESATEHPLGDVEAAVPFYLESTLPYQPVGVVKVQTPTGFKNRTVRGPSSPTYVILDQSYSLKTPGVNCQSHGDPTPNDPDAYERNNTAPKTCGELTEGSGGDYLSNEIFYRTSRIRWKTKPSLPSGHLHVPSIGEDPYGQDRGINVIAGGEAILSSLLDYAVSLTGTNQLNFPDTRINSTASTAAITISVPANYPTAVKIEEIKFLQSPTVFLVDPFTPLTIQPGASGTVTVKFLPTEVREYTDTIRLKTADGVLLHFAELKGKGIAAPPIINGFTPLLGYEGDMITITGQNFEGTTDVSIGGVSVYSFTVANSTTIYAEVAFGRGYVTVTTAGGTATSASTFRLIVPRDDYPII
ncbi:MAG TPA: IPT/TIG domain-containing protein [Pyrinomonadaceae bacterium]|jgi:pyrrolidone-carboxylate peptidase